MKKEEREKLLKEFHELRKDIGFAEMYTENEFKDWIGDCEVEKLEDEMYDFCCPKCSQKLTESYNENYAFTCNDCDEDFYRIEAHKELKKVVNQKLI